MDDDGGVILDAVLMASIFGSPQDFCPMKVVPVLDDVIMFTFESRVCRVGLQFWFLLLVMFVDGMHWSLLCSFMKRFWVKGQILKIRGFLRSSIFSHILPEELVYFLDLNFIDILFSKDVSTTEVFGHQSLCVLQRVFVGQWNKSGYFVFCGCNVFFCCARPQQVVHNMLVRCKCGSLSVETILVLALFFDASRECSAKETYYFHEEVEEPHCRSLVYVLVSQANMKVNENSMV